MSADQDLRTARRRLSVISDNKFVDGVESIEDAALNATAAVASLGDVNEAAADFIVNSYGGFSKKGHAPYNPQKKNQDALIMAEDPTTRSLLFVVMDGHGEHGDRVTQKMKNSFAQYLFQHQDFATDVETALRDTIMLCEKETLSDRTIDTDFSGTTFTCAVIRNNKCILANVGDSRTVLGYIDANGQLKSRSLTVDHKPDLEEEKNRIEAAGGRVFAIEYEDGVDGPPRVWLGNMDIPGLAMSRSLCDVIAHSAGVISEPEIFVYEFNSGESHGDIMLIMASDGLWEFMSNDEVLQMAHSTQEPRFAVDRLITESSHRWMNEENIIDDITICVAFLGNFRVTPQN